MYINVYTYGYIQNLQNYTYVYYVLHIVTILIYLISVWKLFSDFEKDFAINICDLKTVDDLSAGI